MAWQVTPTPQPSGEPCGVFNHYLAQCWRVWEWEWPQHVVKGEGGERSARLCVHVTHLTVGYYFLKINVRSLCVIFSLTSHLHLSSQKLIMPLHDTRNILHFSKWLIRYSEQGIGMVVWNIPFTLWPQYFQLLLFRSRYKCNANFCSRSFHVLPPSLSIPVVRGSGLHLCPSMCNWMKLCTPTNLHMYISE